MQKSRKKSLVHPVVLVALGVVIVALIVIGVVYGRKASYYKTHFLTGTVIDGVDVSEMTIADLQDRVATYSLTVIERTADGGSIEETIPGTAIGYNYASTEPLEEILAEQGRWKWAFASGKDYELDMMTAYDEDLLEEAVDSLRAFDADFTEEPEDAYLADYVSGVGYAIVPDTAGNILKRSAAIEAVRNAVDTLEESVDLSEEGCYETADVTADDKDLVTLYNNLQKYATISITYTFGDNVEVLDGDTLVEWLTVDGTDVILDTDQVSAFVSSLRKTYDTIFHSRSFTTHSGQTLTISTGDYGWWMNTSAETEELLEMIENGESGERTPVYYQTAASYSTPDYGNTYVEVNLTAQHLYFYQNGSCIMDCDIVSGNSSNGNATPAGVYGITYKQRNATLVGEGYASPVDYWMPFNGNIGLHDASWRSSFGGTIYKTNGSHGCINMPSAKAKELYGYVSQGTPVICYYLPGTEPTTPEPEPETEAPAEEATEAPAEEAPAEEGGEGSEG